MNTQQLLKPKQIIVYGLPAIPIAALTLPFFIFVPTFYVEKIGLPFLSVGLVFLIIRLFDAINDPIIGFICDRTNLRFGRRRSWFLIGILPTMLGTWMIFVPGSTTNTIYLAFWGFVLSIGWTMLVLSYSAWGAELSGNYRLRSRLSAARESFVIVGTLITISLPIFISDNRDIDANVLMIIALFICILLPISACLIIWYVPEPKVYSKNHIPIRQGLKFLWQNKPFLRLISAFLLNGLANGLPVTLFLLFITYVLEAPNMQAPLLFIYFCSGIVSVPIWLKLSDRWGKHRTWCIAMLFALPIFLSVILLNAGDIWKFALISMLTGFSLGADLVLPSSIQADVIDVDTATSSEQRSGLYFAFWGLATKLSLAFAVGVAFLLLGLAGFSTQKVNTGFALLLLTLLYSTLPVILKMAAIMLMWNFPLSEKQQIALRQKIKSKLVEG